MFPSVSIVPGDPSKTAGDERGREMIYLEFFGKETVMLKSSEKHNGLAKLFNGILHYPQVLRRGIKQGRHRASGVEGPILEICEQAEFR